MRIVKLTSILLLCWITVNAGVILKTKTKFGNEETDHVLYIQEGKVRTDFQEKEKPSIILDSNEEKFIILNWNEKKYVEYTFEDIKNLYTGLESMIERLKSQLTKEQAEKLEEDMRKKMEALSPVVEEKGEETIDNYPCRVYEITVSGNKVQTVWATDYKNLEITKQDFQAFEKLEELSEKMVSRMMGESGKSTKSEIKGVPIKSVAYDTLGNIVSTNSLIEIKKSGIDPKIFQIPAGFEKVKKETNIE